MLIALRIMKTLSESRTKATELCYLYKISPATLKREIAMARHLGAKIVSKKVKYETGSCFVYSIENWKDCEKKTERWIELEEEKTVISN